LSRPVHSKENLNHNITQFILYCGINRFIECAEERMPERAEREAVGIAHLNKIAETKWNYI